VLFEVERVRLRAYFNAEVYYQIAGRSNRAVPPAPSSERTNRQGCGRLHGGPTVKRLAVFLRCIKSMVAHRDIRP